jgi:hypothetical protein
MISRVVLGFYALFVAPAIYCQTYYCTNSGRLVSTGMSSAQVEQLCGKPNKVEMAKLQEPVARINLYQWSYFSKQLRAPWDKQLSPELTFSFDRARLVKIVVNGQEVQGPINCFGQGNIQTGDTTARVLSVCGRPDLQQRHTETIMGKPDLSLTMIYTRASGLPAVVMTFKSDKLISIGYGSLASK